MMIVELPEREDNPLFHVESLIEGEYVKYNSNSGYVETCRNTPQVRRSLKRIEREREKKKETKETNEKDTK